MLIKSSWTMVTWVNGHQRAIALQDVNVPMVQMDNFTTIKTGNFYIVRVGQYLT